MKLPESLRPLVAGYAWTRNTTGDSPAKTFRLDRASQEPRYLKVAPRSHWKELLSEKQRLDWLQAKLPVPKVLAYAEDHTSAFLLVSAIRGSDAASLTDEMPSKDVVGLLASGLRMIHEIPTDERPFDTSLDKEIERSKFNVDNGLVDETDFDDERMGRSAEALFRKLLSTRPGHEDLVFTHGDYCLPNVLIDCHEIAGFVDWSRAGVADRYKDIALVIRSISPNPPKDTDGRREESGRG